MKQPKNFSPAESVAVSNFEPDKIESLDEFLGSFEFCIKRLNQNNAQEELIPAIFLKRLF